MQELERILEEIENLQDISGWDLPTVQGILRIIREHMNGGWIPVEDHLPGEPKENPVFDDKPLELYLVDMGGSYPLRAFWNGKQFTDGWSVLNVIAWRPLPEPYCPEGREQ